jgi:hypothetical protein
MRRAIWVVASLTAMASTSLVGAATQRFSNMVSLTWRNPRRHPGNRTVEKHPRDPGRGRVPSTRFQQTLTSQIPLRRSRTRQATLVSPCFSPGHRPTARAALHPGCPAARAPSYAIRAMPTSSNPTTQ